MMCREGGEVSDKPKCACVSDDAHDCWAIRYGMRPMASFRDVERDGGPCQCGCHEPDDDFPDDV